MTLYEVELRVSYGRKVLLDVADEDSAVEDAVYDEDVQIQSRPGSFRIDVSYYGVRVVTREEMEDA